MILLLITVVVGLLIVRTETQPHASTASDSASMLAIAAPPANPAASESHGSAGQ